MILGTQHFHFISDKDNCADLVYASFGSSSGRPGLTAFGWGRLIAPSPTNTKLSAGGSLRAARCRHVRA